MEITQANFSHSLNGKSQILIRRLKMRKSLLLLLVMQLPVGLSAQEGDNNTQKEFAFTHVTVIDATGAPAKPDMTVVIRGDRIVALGKSAKLDVSEDTHVVGATGMFLIPGLWDMHVHTLDDKDYLALFITNGVTGVRVMAGKPVHHKWREEISARELIGPRMVIASPIVGRGRVGPLDPGNEDEGRAVVRKVKEEGADFVKVYGSLPRDAYFAIADEAKRLGIPFAGHVPRSVSSVEASGAGQRSIEHGHGVLPACSSTEEELRKKSKAPKTKVALRARKAKSGGLRASVKQSANLTYDEKKAAAFFARLMENNTWVCPTVLVWSEASSRDTGELASDPRLKYMPPSIKHSWNPKNNAMVALATGDGRADCKKLVQNKVDIVGAMGRAGVGLLAGTDAPSPYCFPGFGLHDELALFVQGGLSPMEALQAATYNPAKFFDKLDSIGTIERGKIADLVLLEANPLEDIGNTQKIAAVVVGGKIYDKTALGKMLAQLEAMVAPQKEGKEEELVEAILSSGQIFLTGSGRSELVARSVAKQLIRAGFQVYVTGDATTPSIGKGDLLIAISGSGQSAATYNKASTAKNSGASVVLLTGRSRSRIGRISDQVFVIDPDFYEAAGAFVDELVTLITEKKGKDS
jgi:6-phospho 3-hexuloisomerase